MIDYRCPECQAQMSSPSCLAGREERCPECGRHTTVPGAALTVPPSAEVGQSPRTYPDPLIAALEDPTTRETMLSSLMEIGPEALEMVLLSDRGFRSAAMHLIEMGPQACDHIQPLQQSENPTVSKRARALLDRIAG